tara:strand:- start:508 stop:1347 length:840 start_codon:yes stop_codon:yes gene_type:complete
MTTSKPSAIATGQRPINSWQIISDDCERPLLPKHVWYENLSYYNNLPKTLPNKIRNVRKSSDLEVFPLNVFSNSKLSNIDILLAIFLYKELIDEDFGLTCCICKPSVDFMDKIEANYFDDDKYELELVIRHSGQKKSIKKDTNNQVTMYVFSFEIENLLDKFNLQSGFSLEPKDMRKALINLHQIGYITSSELTFKNTLESNVISDTKREKPRPTLIHIRLCSWMLSVNMSKAWSNTENAIRHKRTRKFKSALINLVSQLFKISQEQINEMDSYKKLVS